MGKVIKMNNINYAKVEDIKIGQKIGNLMNGKLIFSGKIVEITYKGFCTLNNSACIGGYFQSTKNGKMSFSLNNKTNKHIILL